MLGGRFQSNGDYWTEVSVVVGARLELCGILDGNPLSEQRASKVKVMIADEQFCATRCFIAFELRVRTLEVLQSWQPQLTRVVRSSWSSTDWAAAPYYSQLTRTAEPMVHKFKSPYQMIPRYQTPVFLLVREPHSFQPLFGLAPKPASDPTRYVARACSLGTTCVRTAGQVVIKRLAGRGLETKFGEQK